MSLFASLLKTMLPKGTFFLVDSASTVLLKIEVSPRNLITITDKDGQLICSLMAGALS